jgi:hypothetical protein
MKNPMIITDTEDYGEKIHLFEGSVKGGFWGVFLLSAGDPVPTRNHEKRIVNRKFSTPRPAPYVHI